jgi:glycosyltransferase involved in cell wall biosynthesis
MNPVPLISVLVSTFNRSELLETALRTLVCQETHDRFSYEIVVVDNNSTDKTATVLAEIRRKHPQLIRTVREERRGVVHARNRAVSEARGEWLAFFDDDQLAHPSWLEQLFQVAQDRASLCVGGAVKLQLPSGVHRNLGPFCRRLLCETVGKDRVQPYDRLFKPGTGNLMIHRELFEKYGPFDARFNDRGEDTILFLSILRAGNAAWYTPDAIVYHVIPHERLTTEAFVSITRRLARECPHFEKHHYGKMFPVAWSARLARVIASCLPQYLWARCGSDVDRIVDRHCHLIMEWNRVRHGLKLLLPRTDGLTFPASLRPKIAEESGN